jgi:hypothetical protein
MLTSTTADRAATPTPPLDPARGPIFRSGDTWNQHRSDRPSWHPDDCTGGCCWRRATMGPESAAGAPIPPSDRDAFVVQRLIDPAVPGHGFAVTSVYVESVVLPIVGPTSFVLLRRLAIWLEASPAGVYIELADVAADLCLGRKTNRNSPIRHTIARLCRFDMAQWQPDALAVRTIIAPVPPGQLARLSPRVAAIHNSMTRGMGDR